MRSADCFNLQKCFRDLVSQTFVCLLSGENVLVVAVCFVAVCGRIGHDVHVSSSGRMRVSLCCGRICSMSGVLQTPWPRSEELRQTV